MAKIKPEHLPAFAREFDTALREGVITVQQAVQFCNTVYDSTLEQQVRNGERRPAVTPKGNDDGEAAAHHC